MIVFQILLYNNPFVNVCVLYFLILFSKGGEGEGVFILDVQFFFSHVSSKSCTITLYELLIGDLTYLPSSQFHHRLASGQHCHAHP